MFTSSGLKGYWLLRSLMLTKTLTSTSSLRQRSLNSVIAAGVASFWFQKIKNFPFIKIFKIWHSLENLGET